MGQGSWVRGPILSCHGIHIGFRSNQAALLKVIGPTFVPGANPSHRTRPKVMYSIKVDGASGVYTASRGSRPFIATRDFGRLLSSLQAEVQHTVASLSVDRLFVHAGAVGWRGKAILLPGRSGSGKSTLVRELIRAGAVYLSDEFALLDDHGLVHSFARPLLLRTRSGKVAYSVNELGARTADAPLPVGVVVFTNYLHGTNFEPCRLTAGHGVLELVKHIVAVRTRPNRALRIATSVASRCPFLCSPRGEARSTAAAVLLSVLGANSVVLPREIF